MSDESRDLSQAEKKITVVKDEQIHKTVKSFHYDYLIRWYHTSLGVKLVDVLWICSYFTTVIYFLACDKSLDSSASISKSEEMVISKSSLYQDQVL